MSAPTADERAKFKKLTQLPYKDQAVWFANGYWGDGVDGSVANTIWDYTKSFVELDKMGPNKGKGTELDQFWSAKFLEDNDKAITALDRKAALKVIDVDADGKMALIEYLVWKYKKGINETITAPQGDNSAAIKAAQQKIDAVMSQLAECEASLEKQKQAVKDNETAQKENAAAQAKLVKEEEALWFAEAELKKAIEELDKQEAEYKAKIAALEGTIARETGMKQAKAKNELSQLKGEDPLPLRRAKITQEAALRKVQKQKIAVGVAKEAVLAAQAELAKKAQALAKAVKDLEDAYTKLEAKLAEAREELEKVKAKPGGGKGAIWWMEREMFEADARLPTSRMKYKHDAPFSFKP